MRPFVLPRHQQAHLCCSSQCFGTGAFSNLHSPSPQVVSVDLTPYEIYVEDSFFISLEWIEDIGIEGLWFSAGMLGKSLFARATSQDRWVQQKFNIGMGVEILQQKN